MEGCGIGRSINASQIWQQGSGNDGPAAPVFRFCRIVFVGRKKKKEAVRVVGRIIGRGIGRVCQRLSGEQPDL